MVIGLIAEALPLLLLVSSAVKQAEHSWKQSMMATFTFESVIDSWGAWIVYVFRGDWIECRGASPTCSFVALCNGLNVVESEV